MYVGTDNIEETQN